MNPVRGVPGLRGQPGAPALVGSAHAWLSPDEGYRYALTRVWDDQAPVACFVLCNPSTADAFTEDPTLRRCLGYARRLGAGGLLLLNAFALRATDPRALYRHPDPVGPLNDAVLAQALTSTPNLGPVIAGWGGHGKHLGRGDQVADLARTVGRPLFCLGRTKGGHPRHPLYLRADAPLLPYARSTGVR